MSEDDLPTKKLGRVPMLFDMRSENTGEQYRARASDPAGRPAKARFDAHGKVVVRSVRDVDAIMLHQMAVLMGTSAQQVKAAGGDERLARNRRSLGVAAHVSAYRDGDAVLAADPLWYLHGGNTGNKSCVHVELEGIYAGGVPAQQIPAVQVAAACDAIARVVEIIAQLGGSIRYVRAHRQYSATRLGDPGGEAWQRIALEYCEKRLGLKTQPAEAWADGRPIPREWDPRRGVGAYR
jgi:hypothetical protein